MLRPRLIPGRPRRGAAVVEFALVVPLLVSILFFSMYLVDIIRAKYKLQEASRYVAWELSSYSLSDYGGADHNKAFQTAQKAAVEEAAERYKDLDSLEVDSRFGMMLSAQAPQVTVKNQEVAGVDLSIVSGGSGSTGAAGKPINAVYDHFKLNTKGQVEVELTSTLDNKLLPRNYLQKDQGGFFSVDNWGGRDLSKLPIKNRFTLIANGWHLPDGGDAVMNDRKAGMHSGGDTRHGLALQVDRMKFWGVSEMLNSTGLGRITSSLDFVFPAFMGTFVVAHNYTKDASKLHGCNKSLHTSPSGLNNLEEKGRADYLDEDSPVDLEQRCFDTAPFRDTQEYAKSLYKNVFDARGDYFMGCKKAQADMPNTPGVPDSTGRDKNEQKITCE